MASAATSRIPPNWGDRDREMQQAHRRERRTLRYVRDAFSVNKLLPRRATRLDASALTIGSKSGYCSSDVMRTSARGLREGLSARSGADNLAETSMYNTLLALMLGVSFVLSGCNTIEGAGKDIERGGEKIQNAAEKAKQ